MHPPHHAIFAYEYIYSHVCSAATQQQSHERKRVCTSQAHLGAHSNGPLSSSKADPLPHANEGSMPQSRPLISHHEGRRQLNLPQKTHSQIRHDRCVKATLTDLHTRMSLVQRVQVTSRPRRTVAAPASDSVPNGARLEASSHLCHDACLGSELDEFNT